jgi:transaldolase
MNNDYFKRVSQLTPTKFWINNVTREEARLAIEAGAVGCTQNPSYTWKMLTHPQTAGHAKALLEQALKESACDNEVECILQRKLVKEIADVFLPLYQSTHGEHGYVSIQGDPIHEEDAAVIIAEGRLNREMGPNVMIKIPATKAGLEAMGVLLAENTPINATEVMGLSQALEICRLYERSSSQTGKCPKIYYSLITGIYDEYLQKWVKEQGIDVSSDVLFIAGLAIARKTYQITKAHWPDIGFIGGGVRGLQHFTEMVGADVCITMNWQGQAEELLKLNQPVVSRFFNPVPELFVDELLDKVPEFARAYKANGLKVEEFEEYGPVEYFRHMFIQAWENAIEFIKKARTEREPSLISK